MENEQWQSAVKELRESVKEVSERLAQLSVVVQGLSVSSSPSPAQPRDQQHLGSASSEERLKMTFEDFANEVGLRF